MAKQNGTASHLPPGSSSSLSLEHPTPSEQLAQARANGASWRGALSVEAYVRREQYLADQDLTRNGGITWWVLVDTALSPRRVLCGCETLRKKAFVARDGKVEEVWCHGIGSVFCPPENRGKGYAGRMMKELGRRLRMWQAEERPCLFSVLYSDIGKDFYSAHGWEPFDSAHISIPAASVDIQKVCNGDVSKARPLLASDLPELCALDEILLRKSLQSQLHDGRTRVSVVPDIETIRWHHAREDFVSEELYGKVPQIKGAIVGEVPGQRAWCYWTRMRYNEDPKHSKGNTLHILRLVIEDQGGNASKYVPAIQALLASAQHQAKEWYMEEVEMWTPSAEAVAAAQQIEPKAQVVYRDRESIASLMWYGESPLPNGGGVAEKIEWVGNEKYGWC